jgi:hypothetical protein
MLLMVSAAVPVLVNVMAWVGGGQFFPILHPKVRFAGMSFTVPLVSVIVALEDFVVSAAAMALRVTPVFAGTVAGPVKVAGAPLAVVAGLTVPHPGEQTVPFCVSVQFKP